MLLSDFQINYKTKCRSIPNLYYFCWPTNSPIVMNKSLALIGLLFLSVIAKSQLIVVSPALPNDQSSVELIFDASLGNAGLAGYTGDVYAHTGVITNKSTSNSDWKYVKSDWGVNIADCKLAPLGSNKWKLTISPSIRAYYNVPANETIQKMAFVFRSGVQVGGKWLEGKTAENGDIFYEVSPSALNVKITNPTDKFLFVNLNASIPVEVSSLLADSTLLYVGDQKVASTSGSSLSHTVNADAYGRYLVKAIAKNSTKAVSDSFYYYVRPTPTIAELPAGMKDGINYLSSTSVLLSLYAPNKQYCYAIGDFNNWLPDEATYMKRTPDGKRYWVQIDGLIPGKEYIYQYYVDGSIRIGDPYAEKVSDPWNDKYIPSSTYPGLISYPNGKTQGIATVFQTNQSQYVWKSQNFVAPKPTDLVIYELLVRDFSEEQTFQAVIDTIGYLWKLGINAIELMPVGEFEGNLSWGYNPNYYFAVDKYYGSSNKLKQLVDTCHQLGIAIIGDMVLNHAFGTSPYVMLYWDKANNRPSGDSPFYNPVAKHDFNVGFDMNHESADSKKYISRVLKHWLTEYRFDGFRFDLSKGFTQKNTLGNTALWGNYDQSRVDILSAYFDTIKSVNPEAYLILEHLADNGEEKVLANKGMMLWGNMNNNYNEAAMGYTSTSDLTWAAYTSRGWSQPNLVTYMESHDEERQMYKCEKWGNSNGAYKITDTITATQRAALAATFFYTIPGPKMLWQFGERGYDYSINWPSFTNDSRLAEKPARWDYMKKDYRVFLYDRISSLIKLRIENPVFETTNFDMSLQGALKKIRLKNETTSMVVLGNFDVKEASINPTFYTTGMWYEFFTGDSINVTNTDAVISLQAGEYRIYSNKKMPYPYSIIENTGLKTSVNVMPNPVSTSCTIEILHEGNTHCIAEVYTADGRLIEKPFDNQIINKASFLWQPPKSGMYILKVATGKEVTLKRILAN